MPDKCCAPGCTANYDNTAEYISVFRFPADESRRQQSLRRIPRANLNVTKRTVICQRHFEKRFVMTEDKIVVNGVETVIPRERPRLTDDAVPTIFHNVPGYLSTPLPPKRRTPDDRHQEMQQRLNDSFTDWLSSDEVKAFSDVTDNLLPARRYASAGYSDRNVSVCLSVCPSVCPSRAGIVSKRRKLAAWFLHHLVAPRI